MKNKSYVHRIESKTNQYTPVSPKGVAIVPPAYGLDFVDSQTETFDTGDGLQTEDMAAPDMTPVQMKFDFSSQDSGQHFATQMLSALLQRKENPTTIHKIAREGVQGGGGKLPHHSKIKSAFGTHDLSNVQAYTDAQAATASRLIGAEAYTTGNKVAFAQQNPSLYTVAHEAAHIVQQRAGVQLSGGIGKVGDKYETHAHRVAQAVVRGQDATPLLDSYTYHSKQVANTTNTGKNGKTVQPLLWLGQTIETVPGGKSPWEAHAIDFKDVKRWLELNFISFSARFPNHTHDICEEIVQELVESPIEWDWVDKHNEFLDRFETAVEIYSRTPKEVPEEVHFAERDLIGTPMPLFRPSLKNLMDPRSDQWKRIKFQYEFKGSRKGYAAKGIGYSEKKHQGKHIICATSATAIAAGFVVNPQDVNSILVTSKEMAAKLNMYGRQPNAMSAEQAQAVAREFADENGRLVSNVYQVRLESQDPTWRGKLREMQLYAEEQLGHIIAGLEVGDRIYIGYQRLKAESALKDDSPLVSQGGHAIAGIKTGEGVFWFQSNAGTDKAPKTMVAPEAGDQFKYFITKPAH